MKRNEISESALKKRKKIAALKTNSAAWLLLLPLLLMVFLMIWYPQALSFFWSFFKMQGYTPVEFVGLKNYITVFTNTVFPQILMNTVSYVIWSMIIGFLPPFICAIMLNEIVHFKSGLKSLIYFPAVLPGIAVSMMWYLIYFPDGGGLLNMLLSYVGIGPQEWLQNRELTIPLMVVSMTWRGMPSTMLLYLASLQGINQELYEAATIDGAGFWKKLFKITLPQMSGILLIMFVQQIINIFQIMEQPMSMTGGGPNNASITMAYWAYKEGFENFRIGSAMAISNILFVILIVVTSFYFYLDKKVNDKS